MGGGGRGTSGEVAQGTSQITVEREGARERKRAVYVRDGGDHTPCDVIVQQSHPDKTTTTTTTPSRRDDLPRGRYRTSRVLFRIASRILMGFLIISTEHTLEHEHAVTRLRFRKYSEHSPLIIISRSLMLLCVRRLGGFRSDDVNRR